MLSENSWTVRRGQTSQRWFACSPSSWTFTWFDTWREAFDFAVTVMCDA